MKVERKERKVAEFIITLTDDEAGMLTGILESVNSKRISDWCKRSHMSIGTVDTFTDLLFEELVR